MTRLLSLLTVLALAGCGGGSTGPTALQRDADALAAAARAGNPAQVQQALLVLRRQVAADRAAGDLDAAAAARVLAAASVLAADVPLPVVRTPAPSVAPVSEGADKGEDHGKGKGKGDD